MLLNAMVKNLEVYKDNSKGTYRGIRREFFPRWEGWAILENGGNLKDLDEAVERFYLSFYYYHLKLDQVMDKQIAFALLNFSTLHGKKKALQKVSLVASSIDELNLMGVSGSYKVLLEILDFYSYVGNTNTSWVYQVYRNL
jgi:hypothetical protein